MLTLSRLHDSPLLEASVEVSLLIYRPSYGSQPLLQDLPSPPSIYLSP
jgi:hypothetical protein